MPTGYTFPIEDRDDFTFEDYVWGCARAFGAMIMMRDDPADAPIPEEFEPNKFYLNMMDEARVELAGLDRITIADVSRRIQEERGETEEDNAGYRRKNEVNRARYSAMRDRVSSWQPPTPDHEGLKRFMLEQIDLSMPSERTYQCDLPVESPERWLESRRAELRKDIGRYSGEWVKEVARTNGRNEWVRRLRESVPIGGPPKETVGAVSGGFPDGSPESWRDREPLI